MSTKVGIVASGGAMTKTEEISLQRGFQAFLSTLSCVASL